MHIFNKFRGSKGFISNWERMLRFRYMITEKAKQRIRILAFWEKYGNEATEEAFKVSLRTLFRWQATLKKSGGKLDSLNAVSTSPKGRRKRIVPKDLKEHIVKLRKDHPRIGKEKIQPLLTNAGYQTSVSTVGRILDDLKKQGRISAPTPFSFNGRTGEFRERRFKRKKKLRRPLGYRVLEVDTVVRFIDGIKRYILTGVDTERRTAFAACYTNL